MNFISKDNRTVTKGMKVKVYRNLHNGMWSIKHKGLVLGYTDQITLENVEFKVGEKGRQRVIKEGRKNVHAYAEGFITDIEEKETLVTYNPFRKGSFYEKETGKDVKHSEKAFLTYGKVFI